MNWLLGGSAVSLGLALVSALWKHLRRAAHSENRADGFIKRARLWVRNGIAHILVREWKEEWLVRTKVLAYSDLLASRHEGMSTPGTTSLPIATCYVSLDLRMGQASLDLTLLGYSGSVILTGDPGSGKTALLSRLTSALCADLKRRRGRSRLPIYLPCHTLLRYLPDDTANVTPTQALDTIETWLAHEQTGPLARYDASGLFKAFTTSRTLGVVLLIDGLDEVDIDALGSVDAFLEALQRGLAFREGPNLLIVATRAQALEFAPRLLSGTGGTDRIALDGFSDAAIYSFVHRWLQHRNGRKGTIRAANVMAQLSMNPTLLDTCRSPLLLSLYMERFYGWPERTTLGSPSGMGTRAGFFELVLNHLVNERRPHQRHEDLPPYPLGKTRMQFFVGLARDHLDSDDPYNVMSQRHLEGNSQYLGGNNSAVDNVAHLLKATATDTGIIRERTDGAWEFTHRSFLDYFAACALVRQTANTQQFNGVLSKAIRNPNRFGEAMLLTVGLLSHGNHPQLTDRLQQLSTNARVSRYYPQACLEAEYYTADGFGANLRANIDAWMQEVIEGRFPDPQRLRILTTVIHRHEIIMRQLNRTPEVTLAAEFVSAQKQGLLGDEALSALSVKTIGEMLGQSADLLGLLERRPVEDAIVNLYDEDVLRLVVEASNRSVTPRLAALVVECALRSSFAASALAPTAPSLGASAILRHGHGWADCWVIRGTRYGTLVKRALTYVGDDTYGPGFPRLRVLRHVVPYRNFATEVAFGDGKRSIIIAIAMIFVSTAARLMGMPWIYALFLAMVVPVAFMVACGVLVRRGLLTLNSMHVLNCAVSLRDLAPTELEYAGVVSGQDTALPRWASRLPEYGVGPYTALYCRVSPMRWKRFCPSMGDRKLRLRFCALLMSLWTEDIRKVMKS